MSARAWGQGPQRYRILLTRQSVSRTSKGDCAARPHSGQSVGSSRKGRNSSTRKGLLGLQLASVRKLAEAKGELLGIGADASAGIAVHANRHRCKHVEALRKLAGGRSCQGADQLPV